MDRTRPRSKRASRIRLPRVYRLATQRKYKEIVEETVDADSVEWTDVYGSTALHVLCQAKDETPSPSTALLRVLLGGGGGDGSTNSNAPDEGNSEDADSTLRRELCPLLRAVHAIITVRPSLIGKCNHAGWTPLHYACDKQLLWGRYIDNTPLILLLLWKLRSSPDTRVSLQWQVYGTGMRFPTAFHMCCKNNVPYEVLEAFLRLDPALARMSTMQWYTQDPSMPPDGIAKNLIKQSTRTTIRRDSDRDFHDISDRLRSHLKTKLKLPTLYYEDRFVEKVELPIHVLWDIATSFVYSPHFNIVKRQSDDDDDDDDNSSNSNSSNNDFVEGSVMRPIHRMRPRSWNDLPSTDPYRIDTMRKMRLLVMTFFEQSVPPLQKHNDDYNNGGNISLLLRALPAIPQYPRSYATELIAQLSRSSNDSSFDDDSPMLSAVACNDNYLVREYCDRGIVNDQILHVALLLSIEEATVLRLAETRPHAVCVRYCDMYPAMIAAANPFYSVDVVFELLRRQPDVVIG